MLVLSARIFTFQSIDALHFIFFCGCVGVYVSVLNEPLNVGFPNIAKERERKKNYSILVSCFISFPTLMNAQFILISLFCPAIAQYFDCYLSI